VALALSAAWTKNWLAFDNSYFTRYKESKQDSDLLWFPTDDILAIDAGFKPTFEKYAADEKAFFAEYAQAHKKLSELGCKFEPAAGLTL